jgi:hypothetical protein
MSNTPRGRRTIARLVARTMLWLLSGVGVVAALLGGYYVEQSGMASYRPPRAPDELPAAPELRPDALVEGKDGKWRPRGPFPGVRLPPARPAAGAPIRDDREVLGVRVDGRARAYLLAALSFPNHVVNDLVGGSSVSVAYCDKTGCARAFTGGRAGEPLALDVGGWADEKGMTLRHGGVEYAEETGENLTTPGGAPLPHRRLTFERTTWGTWRKAHPDTDVYTGDFPADPLPEG